MNVEFKDGKAIMSMEDFISNFNYDGKATSTYVAGTTVAEIKDVHDITTEIIIRRGLKPHLLGYKYTRKAVELCMQDITYLDGITKRLYPDIAKEYGTLPSRAERAIRHSIEVIYGGERKPTNSEFIAQIVEEVSAEIKKQNRMAG